MPQPSCARKSVAVPASDARRRRIPASKPATTLRSANAVEHATRFVRSIMRR
jgi:hypothetical protein